MRRFYMVCIPEKKICVPSPELLEVRLSGSDIEEKIVFPFPMTFVRMYIIPVLCNICSCVDLLLKACTLVCMYVPPR